MWKNREQYLSMCYTNALNLMKESNCRTIVSLVLLLEYMLILCIQIQSGINSFVDVPFFCPATKSGGELCYTLRTFECLSVRLSVRPSVRPSAVDHSCPLYNFDTVQDNFTKLGTNVKHDQTTCRD